MKKIVSRKNINKKIDYLIVFAWNYFKEIKKKITFAKKIISIREQILRPIGIFLFITCKISN